MNISLNAIFVIGLLAFTYPIFAQNNSPIPFQRTDKDKWTLFQLDENVYRQTYKEEVRTATFLTLDRGILQRIRATRPAQILFSIPTEDGEMLEAILEEQQLLTPDFLARTSASSTERYEAGLYYQGHIKGHEKQRVAISMFNNMVMGMFLLENETYVLGHLEQQKFPVSDSYVLYKESDVLVQNPFTCGNEALHNMGVIGDDAMPEVGGDNRSGAARSVKVYFEADYQLYQDKNEDTDHVLDYITGLFNNVKMIYENENIIVEISEIFVWTTNDPYPSNSSSAALTAFRNRLNGDFNGNVAHLLSTAGGRNGGIAYVDVLCLPEYAVAYSNIADSYNDFPFYSWTVNVVSHEMGHNIGSQHTQSCTWPGGAIDNCYAVEGTCSPGPSPVNGGTIMSYCHLTNFGTNLNKGFGLLPGNKIRAETTSSNCLTEATDNSTGLPNLTQEDATLAVNGPVVDISLTVVNIGIQNAGTSTIDYYLSEDASFSGTADYYIGSSNVPTVAVEGSRYVSFSKNVTNDAPYGTYKVILVMDAQSQVIEWNENDNIFGWTSPVVTIEGGDFYCLSGATTATYEWISSVSLGDIQHTSNSNGGYANFTHVSTNLQQNTSYAFSANTTYNGSPYGELWKVWIDYNHDLDFEDDGELAYTSGTPVTSTTSGTIAIPADAALGTTRMRVSMKWLGEDNINQGPCSIFGYGEVEDYLVYIVDADNNGATNDDDDDDNNNNGGGNGTLCSLDNITAGAQTACNATTNTYTQVIQVYYSCEEEGTLQIYANGASVVQTDLTGSPQTITLTSLPANGGTVNLEAYLCPDGEDCWELSENGLFVAPASCGTGQGACTNYPDNQDYIYLTGSSVTLTWEAMPNAIKYEVGLRQKYTYSWGSWSYHQVTSTSSAMTNLNNATQYQFKVRTQCPSGWTNWSPKTSFTTLGNLPNTGGLSSPSDGIQEIDIPTTDKTPSLEVFPNPAQNTISLKMSDGLIQNVRITDMRGTLVKQFSAAESQGSLDIADVEAGVYFVVAVSEVGTWRVNRLVKF